MRARIRGRRQADGHHRHHHRLWFRTGDLGVWEEEAVCGSWAALTQIKLRGIRIELGEVEAVARQSSVITAAAAVIDDQLILYVVPAAASSVRPTSMMAAATWRCACSCARGCHLRCSPLGSLRSATSSYTRREVAAPELPTLQLPSSPSPLSQAESTEALRG